MPGTELRLYMMLMTNQPTVVPDGEMAKVEQHFRIASVASQLHALFARGTSANATMRIWYELISMQRNAKVVRSPWYCRFKQAGPQSVLVTSQLAPSARIVDL